MAISKFAEAKRPTDAESQESRGSEKVGEQRPNLEFLSCPRLYKLRTQSLWVQVSESEIRTSAGHCQCVNFTL